MKGLLISLVIAASILSGLPKGNTRDPQGRIYDLKNHNANQWLLPITNFGEFGQDIHSEAGGEWPRGSGHMYIFGAGPWLGCKVRKAGGFDTLVTICYDMGSGGNEVGPGLVGQNVSDPAVKVYMHPQDWPIPKDIFPMAPTRPRSHQDGWTVFNDADPAVHVPHDTRPMNIEVYQHSFAWNLYILRDIVFIEYKVKNKNTDTLHEFYFGMTTDDDVGTASDDVTGLRRQRTYVVGGETLRMDDVAFTCDYHYAPGPPPWGCVAYDFIGTPYALNDGKDNDSLEDQRLYRPEYQGRILDHQEVSDGWFMANIPAAKWDADQDGIMDWKDPSCIEQFGLTSFKAFTLDNDPPKDWAKYMNMAGYEYLTRIYKPYDSIDPGQADKRFCMATGPITLPPESSTVVLVAVIGANYPLPGGLPGDSFDLARKSSIAQYIYDHNWLLPDAPPAPNLVCVPGDHRVTLLWDNLSESTPDPYYPLVSDPSRASYEPFYQQYDFQGYRLWQSKTGLDDWRLLATWDRADGDTFTFSDYCIPESIEIKATDSRLRYSYVDSTVRNGFTYYYAVTAFDHNYVKVVDTTGTITGSMPIILESGRSPIAASPRTHAAGIKFTPPVFAKATIKSANYNARVDLDFNATFPNPYLTQAKYYLTFDSTLDDASSFRLIALPTDSTNTTFNYYVHPVYKYKLTTTLPDSVLIGSFAPYPKSASDFTYPVDTVALPIFRHDGVQLNFVFNHKIGITDSCWKRIIITGSYPDTLPRNQTLDGSETPYTAWAHTGNSYEIRWKAHPQGGITCDVYDKDAKRFLPYTPCSLLGQLETDAATARRVAGNAYGWFFRGLPRIGGRYVPNDSLVRAVRNGTKWMYIAGFRLALKPNAGALEPTDPMPSPGDIWTLEANDSISVPPLQAYEIEITPGLVELEKLAKLNVKVVPNPYVITNEWQRSRFQRKVKFINLPPECTIRIFTTNGELIRTLQHNQKVKGSAQTNELGGDEWWDVLTEYNQMPASGVYIFHVYSKDVGEQVGKFVIIQ